MDLTVSNLNFSYDDKLVFKNLSFEIKNGSSIAVVGVSGCGKSTLLNFISGYLSSKSNSNIKVNGETPTDFTARRKTGIMFQDQTLFPYMNVKNNILFPSKIIKGLDTSLIDELIEKVGLESDSEKFPNQLSGGMKSRVCLARAFFSKPELLILDEPFSNLDTKHRNLLYIELHKLIEEYNTNVLFVTHDIEEAILLANNILVLGMDGAVLESFVIEGKLPRQDDIFEIPALKKIHKEIKTLIMNS